MRVFLVSLLALVAIPAAAAPGVSLRWDHCFPDPTHRIVRRFACDTNAGFELKTVGTGACAGCEVPLTLVLNSVKLTTPVATNDRTLAGAVNGTDSNFAIWSPDVVPVAKTTWGAVKSLYR